MFCGFIYPEILVFQLELTKKLGLGRVRGSRSHANFYGFL